MKPVLLSWKFLPSCELRPVLQSVIRQDGLRTDSECVGRYCRYSESRAVSDVSCGSIQSAAGGGSRGVWSDDLHTEFAAIGYELSEVKASSGLFSVGPLQRGARGFRGGTLRLSSGRRCADPLRTLTARVRAATPTFRTIAAASALHRPHNKETDCLAGVRTLTELAGARPNADLYTSALHSRSSLTLALSYW